MNMKRIYLLLYLLLFQTMVGYAQDNSQNYILTRTMLKPDMKSYLSKVVYYDGLGRPFQTVNKAIENNNKKGVSLATLQEYDMAGRETKAWLPIVVPSDYLVPTSFKSSAPGSYDNDSRPYQEIVYETSPQNRILKKYGAGADWYSGHPVATEFMGNDTTAQLRCIRYKITPAGALEASGDYANGTLNVTRTTDEDGNASYTFMDKIGRALLERRMNGSETLDTYYVYDNYGNLRYVLPPAINGNISIDVLNLYAYQYEYDGFNRCVRKKLPGTQYIEYVYDTYDRLIFSQDGNQRARNIPTWTYYLYDNLNRLVQQGECTGKNVSSNATVHVRNHYDDYSFVGTGGFTDSCFVKDTLGYAKGLLTGCEIAVLGNGTKLYSTLYYDIRGRVVKTVESNLLGGYDRTTTTYTFSGKPQSVIYTHTATGQNSKTREYNYIYDYSDRLIKVKHILNGMIVTLADYTYDDLNRLQSKSLHGSVTNKLTYTYNVRSWLTGISGNKFTQNLYYNTGNGTARYNGNISSMTWKAGTESTVRGYKFTYDGLDRMLNATYGETAAINTNANRFSENVTGYDKNGNIKSLQRYGQTAASSYGLIDNLTFTFSGNQLNRVDDAVTASAYNNGFEFKDAVKQANEYAYDANGNLTKDLNKNITDIQYNFLNLPSKVMFSDGSTVAYTYAADGTKLRTVHKIGGMTTTTDYCGDVIYENGVQKLLLTEEGYVTLNDSKYHYYLQDHQGNNRVVINQSGTVEETNHYYPFGGMFASSSSVQPYKYNGKEYDNKKGLNWYDYGARHYDAALGRFHTNDRFAEKYQSLSTYQYGANNPVRNIDVNGDTIIVAPNPNGLFDNVRMAFGSDTKYQKTVKADLQQLKKDDADVAKIISELEESRNLHYITMPKKGQFNSVEYDGDKMKKKVSQGSKIFYNPYNQKRGSLDREKRSPRVGLSHELQHSFDLDKKYATGETIENGIKIMDVRAVNTENKIRRKTGDPKRTMYGTRKIPKELLE